MLYYTTKEGATDLTGFILLCWYRYTILLLLLQLNYLAQEIFTHSFFVFFFNQEPVSNCKHWCTTEMVFMPTSKDKVCQDLKGSNCCSGVSFSTRLWLRPQALTRHRHIKHIAVCSSFLSVREERQIFISISFSSPPTLVDI